LPVKIKQSLLYNYQILTFHDSVNELFPHCAKVLHSGLSHRCDILLLKNIQFFRLHRFARDGKGNSLIRSAQKFLVIFFHFFFRYSAQPLSKLSFQITFG